MKTKSTSRRAAKKASIKSLLKRQELVSERIERADRFPLQYPLQIVTETTDWRIDRRVPKDYPGAASFVLGAKG